jgi:polyisoprenoid-binding protein YceI
MKFLILTLALMAFPLTATSQENTATKLSAMPAGVYKLDETHASLTWKVSHLGLSNYTARFTKMDADILLDPMDLANSKVIATIDPTSIKTDFPHVDKKDFDAQLINDAGWFNTTQFPKITYKSNKIEITGDNTAKMMGRVTFLGVTQPITLDVVFNKALGNHPFKNKPAIGFSATGSLKRSDFGMNTYIPNIGDNVDIIIEAEFIYGE